MLAHLLFIYTQKRPLVFVIVKVQLYPRSGMNVLSWWNTSTITRVFPHFSNIVFLSKIWMYILKYLCVF